MRASKADVMFTEIQWDIEVDVLCIGAEEGLLAAGIVAANAGLDVYLGLSEHPVGGADLATALSYQGGEGQTTRHLAGFDYAFGRAGHAQNSWPVRAVESLAPPEPRPRGAIQPFFGAALEQWAYRCAAAPSGLIYNRVSNRQMREVRSGVHGEKVEAAVVGSVELGPALPALSLTSWLRNEAAQAGLQLHTDVRLVELIFEDHALAGALLETDDGVRAVRARENLVLAIGDSRTELVGASAAVTAHVCLVSKAASRFGELEIITENGDDNRLLFVDAPAAAFNWPAGSDAVAGYQLPSWQRAV